jgi:integrase
MAKLTDFRCKAAGPGTHSDGLGLLLRVRTNAAGVTTRAWTYRYTLDGKQTWLGLGSYPSVSLAQARERAADARKLRACGNDPLAAKRAQRAAIQQRAEQMKDLTFDQAAGEYIQSHRAGWRSLRHAEQWEETLGLCNPVFGGLPVGSIDLALVLRVLEPLWTARPETGNRLRGRIERVLDWAKVREYRSGENPARWRGQLEHVLPRPSKLRAVQHHRSLPYVELPEFMAALCEKRDAVTAHALRFLILTATRTSETLMAQWSEIDLEARSWVIPRERTKTFKEHRAPLSDAAIAVLREMVARRENEFVFPGPQRKVLSHNALKGLLRRMRVEVSVHGFRSSFRDWAAERTSYPAEVCEMALAHRVGSQVENAYRRTDMFERRRRLMADWADFCAGLGVAKVVPLRALTA